MPTVTYNMTEANGRRFKVIGTGATAALAKAEAEAKVKVTVGTVLNAQTSDVIAVPATPATGTYSDAVLKVSRGLQYPTHTIDLENVSNAYAVVGGKGKINIANQDIIDLAAAYRDGSNLGGYVPIDGYFVS